MSFFQGLWGDTGDTNLDKEKEGKSGGWDDDLGEDWVCFIRCRLKR